MTYKRYGAPNFDRTLGKIDKAPRERIDSVIRGSLSTDPYRNTGRLKGIWEGMRSVHVGKYRVIFAIVEEVRKLGLEGSRKELDFVGMPDKAIVLIDVGLRKNIYAG